MCWLWTHRLTNEWLWYWCCHNWDLSYIFYISRFAAVFALVCPFRCFNWWRRRRPVATPRKGLMMMMWRPPASNCWMLWWRCHPLTDFDSTDKTNEELVIVSGKIASQLRDLKQRHAIIKTEIAERNKQMKMKDAEQKVEVVLTHRGRDHHSVATLRPSLTIGRLREKIVDIINCNLRKNSWKQIPLVSARRMNIKIDGADVSLKARSSVGTYGLNQLTISNIEFPPEIDNKITLPRGADIANLTAVPAKRQTRLKMEQKRKLRKRKLRKTRTSSSKSVKDFITSFDKQWKSKQSSKSKASVHQVSTIDLWGDERFCPCCGVACFIFAKRERQYLSHVLPDVFVGHPDMTHCFNARVGRSYLTLL